MDATNRPLNTLDAGEVDSYIDSAIDRLFVPRARAANEDVSRGESAPPEAPPSVEHEAEDPGEPGAPIESLHEALLSLDWEVSERNITGFEASVKALAAGASGDKHVAAVAQMTGGVCKYLRALGESASPLGVQFPGAVVRTFEVLLGDPAPPPAEAKAAVEQLLEKYRRLQSEVRRRREGASSSDDEPTQTPLERDAAASTEALSPASDGEPAASPAEPVAEAQPVEVEKEPVGVEEEPVEPEAESVKAEAEPIEVEAEPVEPEEEPAEELAPEALKPSPAFSDAEELEVLEPEPSAEDSDDVEELEVRDGRIIVGWEAPRPSSHDAPAEGLPFPLSEATPFRGQEEFPGPMAAADESSFGLGADLGPWRDDPRADSAAAREGQSRGADLAGSPVRSDPEASSAGVELSGLAPEEEFQGGGLSEMAEREATAPRGAASEELQTELVWIRQTLGEMYSTMARIEAELAQLKTRGNSASPTAPGPIEEAGSEGE